MEKKEIYLLVHDVGDRFRLFRHLGLKTPDPKDPIFTEFQTELAAKIKSALPDVSVTPVCMLDLADEIMSKAQDKRSALKNAVTISTCQEIAGPSRGHVIEVNRIIGANGDIIGLGPRPGYPAIEDQLSGFAFQSNDQPLVLVEDGSFSGSTMCYILKKAKERGLPVSAVVLGFVFPNAMDAIRKDFKGDIIAIEKRDKLFEWVPDHDFFPFAPNCGRVFGVSVNGRVYPFYTHNGASYCVPYIMPFGPVSKWASIPEKAANAFSLFCLRHALNFFEHLEKLNKKEIKIGDVVGQNSRFRVSIPVSVGQSSFPQLNTRITHFLHETCHELA